MADIVSYARKIEARIELLAIGRKELQKKAENKAGATGQYDKNLAIAIIRLKEEGKFPATLIEKIAKGECSSDRVAMELAEAEYRLTSTKMQAIQAELNGYQSIFRHLESG